MKKLAILIAMLIMLGMTAGISSSAEQKAPRMEVLTGQVMDGQWKATNLDRGTGFAEGYRYRR
jgi:hypothetical protein